MKQYVTSSAMILMMILISTSAYATETRVQSMGGVGLYTYDNSNIYHFPALINRYVNESVAELRAREDDDSYSIGLNTEIGDMGILGIYIHNPIRIPVDAVIADMAADALLGHGLSVTLEHTLDIFYGRELEAFDLGLHAGYAMDGFTDEPAVQGGDEYKETAHFFTLGGGISNDMFDIGANLDITGIKKEMGSGEDSWSGFGFGAKGRAHLDIGGGFELVPLGVFYFAPSSRDMDPGVAGMDPVTVDYSNLLLGLGAGVNYAVNQDNLIVLGFEVLGLDKMSTDIENLGEQTETDLTFPGLYMGIESRIKPWLTGRFGAAQTFSKFTETTKPQGGPEESDSENNLAFALTFGMGINFGNFTLDASINEGMFFDGPDFLSGQANRLSNRLSLTYNF